MGWNVAKQLEPKANVKHGQRPTTGEPGHQPIKQSCNFIQLTFKSRHDRKANWCSNPAYRKTTNWNWLRKDKWASPDSNKSSLQSLQLEKAIPLAASGSSNCLRVSFSCVGSSWATKRWFCLPQMPCVFYNESPILKYHTCFDDYIFLKKIHTVKVCELFATFKLL